jgi:probable phosphoglycerate mutase
VASAPEGVRQIRFAAPPGAARLLLLRHGETTPVVEGVPVPMLDGQSNPDLDPVGVEQAALAAPRLAAERPAAIYVTPLVRTHQTAAPLVALTGLEPRVEPGLMEINLGEWEGGEFRRRVAAGDPIVVRMLTEQRWDLIPGAESNEAFGGRVRAGVERVAAAHPDRTVVVVAHGGTIGEILAQASGARPLAFAPDNGSISEVVVAGDRWTVRRFNDTAHLGDQG